MFRSYYAPGAPMAHNKAQIQLIAESLLPGFIPKDLNETNLIFHFTLPPKASYKVKFIKDGKGNWIFEDFQVDDTSGYEL